MKARAPRGLTLIEITVALGIIVVLFAAVVFGVGALTGAKARESAAELAGTIRALYDSAALSGRTCRLVFELPGERDEDGAVTWRAECAKGSVTAGAKRDDELRAANEKDKRDRRDEDDERFRPLASDSAPTVQELQAREQSRVEEQAKFSSFSSDDVVEKTLPSNVRVEVWTQKQRQPVKHGTAYLYFFPQGYTEKAQVWVRQGDNAWTLTISSLTGKTVIHNEDLEVPRT
ncbi:MAG: type II secretion system protein [Myxococcota bacterium]